jgi:putative ABC transport system permease protein
MTAFVMIMHYVIFERSYDKFHDDYERIYRIRYERYSEDGSSVRFASCCPPAGALIRDRYPEVEKLGRILRYKASVSYENKYFMEERMYFAETDFLEIFKVKFIKGNPHEGIKEPGNTFISKLTAEKYFGDEDPMGKTLSVDKKTNYKVAGVFEDIPENSHLKFDILLSYQNVISLYGEDFQHAWGHTGVFTYAKLKPGTDLNGLENKLDALVEEQFGEALKYYKMVMKLPVQPLTDIHLNSHFMQEYEINGNKDAVDILFIIAVFVIIMAWVNYINLSTAGALNRAREVGLRKVVGASRFNLVVQFFAEIILLNLFAVLFSMALVYLFTPLFNSLTGMTSSVNILRQGWFFPMLLVLFVIGVAFSGFYPVIAMSSFKPLAVLKGNFLNTEKGTRLRKGLVVFQFAIAFILLTGTLAVYKQISFMQSRDLGFNVDQTLVVQSPRVRSESYGEDLKTFKEVLQKINEIKIVSHVTEVPGRQIYWDAGAIRKQGEDASKGKNYQIVGVDYDFVNLFELGLIAGRNFSKEFPADKDNLMMNETAVKFMGFESSESAVGQKVDYWENIYTIVGVIKDYHQQSLKEEFEPHLFRLLPEGRGTMGQIAVKLNSTDMKESVDFVKSKYEEFFPGNPFVYFFLDEYYDQQYKADLQFGQVVGVFSLLSVMITLLGIFALSLKSALQKTKEIGIRKVLGADVSNLLLLLSRDFIILLVVSFIISLPVLYYGLNKFLDEYANRINLDVWLFIVPMCVIILVTILTTAFQFLKAALANPVKSIRYE